MKFSATLLCMMILTTSAFGADAAEPTRPQRKNLLDAPTKARFKTPTERVWPAKAGEADICLWADDKFAAINITIDDNMVPDHKWWIQQTTKHDFKATWFIIVGKHRFNSGQPAFGSWADFRKLKALGHEVQSHTIKHNANDDQRPDAEVDANYRQSKMLIEKNIPGQKCTTMAYPCGKGNRKIAAKYFVAVRGVYGTPNIPNKIDYMDVNSAGGRSLKAMIDGILTGKSSIKWVGPQYKRAWCSFHFHGVKDRPSIAKQLDYMSTKRDQVWVGTFGEIARYGQERDTVTLTMEAAGPDRITFTLSDEMDDTLFDYPLTVKVRLFDDWKAVEATQGGKPAPVTLVRHDGGSFALVKAVPDAGPVELAAKATAAK